MNLKEDMGWESVDWIYLAQDTKGSVVDCCEHGNEPAGFVKCVVYFLTR